MITPRRRDGNGADLSAALELVDFVGRAGVDGIALAGSTGEFVHFDIEDRLHVARFAIKRSRVPVTVNVSHSSLEGALRLARESVSCGAAALLLMPPYFFHYSQEDIEEFYLRFARELGPSVPLLLYNIPAFTSEIRFETAMQLLSTGLFAGIKDSSGRMDEFRRMQALKGQTPFTLLIGNDRILREARCEGADGGVSGVASALPELLVGMECAIRTGALPRLDRIEARLREFISWSERFSFPMAIREAVALRGLSVGPPAVPPGPAAQGLLGEFREWFQGWLPVALKEAAGA